LVLFITTGPHFFIVSAQAPLTQRWYALETARGEPSALYAASNLGSFAGLLSYPLLAEPLLTLHQQSLVWTGGYVLLVLLVGACALTIPPSSIEQKPRETSPAPSRMRLLHWVALAAVPSGLMLSTTTHLTTDIVAIPLLWVVPLGLYLLSFVLAFATRRGATRTFTNIAPLVLLIAGGFAFSGGSSLPLFTATLGLFLLFTISVVLHGQLYRLRPASDHLTAFYLAMAVGGVLGGIVCAIVAPSLFDWAYEHPLLILAGALLLPQAPLFSAAARLPARSRWLLLILAFGLSFAADIRPFGSVDKTGALAMSIAISLIGLLFIGRRFFFPAALAALMLSYGGWHTLDESRTGARTRSYFGVYTVSERASPPARLLTHGTTLHGVENLTPGLELEPTSYYARRSGVGHAMASAPVLFGPNARIGVVGLGTGTLACYALPGQAWSFFEIDPAVVRIASNPADFKFLASCAPDARIVIGDARVSLARQPPGQIDLLAVDAFSSDAVPMHLLTREALAVYGRALQPEGLLLVHISNRYLDLEPVLAAAQRTDGWSAMISTYTPEIGDPGQNLTTSIWVAMSRSPKAIDSLRMASGADAFLWRPLAARKGFPGWTDDYASILPLLENWHNWIPTQ
jgi:hypothetical protein